MTLEFENVGKVRHAKIDLDGLTVIVGDNNSGKSTVGKVLASLFTILPTLGSRVMKARRDYVFDEDAVRVGYRFRRFDLDEFARLFEDANLSEDAFRASLSEWWRKGRFPRRRLVADDKWTAEEDALLKETSSVAFSRLLDCRQIPDAKLVDLEVGKGFARYFYGAVRTGGAERASVKIVVKGEANEIFWGESVSCRVRTAFTNRGWFLGSPLLVNSVSDERSLVCDPERMHEPLLELLNGRQSPNSVSRALVGDRIRPIEERLEAVLEGRIFYSEEDGELMISGKGYPKPLPVTSLSMGLKAFALLRWMLEKGALRERDVLVLDEPENHLHPKWQILYAELIVLFQKCFDLTVLLTTHSPYFLEAIQLYAKRHGVAERLSAYQPTFDETGLTTTLDEPVTDSRTLYRKFTATLRELDVLRAEAEGEA